MPGRSEIAQPTPASALLHLGKPAAHGIQRDHDEQPHHVYSGQAEPVVRRIQRPRIIVGLGNAEPRYTSSPHNVGYRTLDVLADRLGLEWAEHGDVTTASAQVGGRDVRFVKFRTDMNDTGPRLRHLAQRIGSAAGDCVVILDDMDLAPGVARWRPRGSAGGHRGLSSVLVAFQSDAIPRVKIGVGKPATGSASTFVTSPMEPWRRILVEDAFVHAADLVLEVLEAPTGAGRTITVADRAGVLRDDPAGA